MENHKFIEIFYGHATDIKDKYQRFEFKIITNQMLFNYFQGLNPSMHQTKKLYNGSYKNTSGIYKVQ